MDRQPVEQKGRAKSQVLGLEGTRLKNLCYFKGDWDWGWEVALLRRQPPCKASAMVMHTWEDEGRVQAHGHPWLHSKLGTSLGYIRTYL